MIMHTGKLCKSVLCQLSCLCSTIFQLVKKNTTHCILPYTTRRAIQLYKDLAASILTSVSPPSQK